MGRVVGFLSAGVGIITSAIAGATWLVGHVSPGALYLTMLVVLAVLLAATLRVTRRVHDPLPPGTGVLLYLGLVFLPVGVALLAESVVGFSEGTAEYIVAYALLAAGVLPLLGAVLVADRTSAKTCPDCAERVLQGARVCKHCGWRFAPRPLEVEGI